VIDEFPAFLDPPRPSLRRTARRKLNVFGNPDPSGEGVCCSPFQWCCPAVGQNEWLPMTVRFFLARAGVTIPVSFRVLYNPPGQNYIVLLWRKTEHKPARKPKTPQCVTQRPCLPERSNPDSVFVSRGAESKDPLDCGTILEKPFYRNSPYLWDPSGPSPRIRGILSIPMTDLEKYPILHWTPLPAKAVLP
jgi:hypothetical protein